MKQPGNDTADVVLRKLDEQYQKYKYMEVNLVQKKMRFGESFHFFIGSSEEFAFLSVKTASVATCYWTIVLFFYLQS